MTNQLTGSSKLVPSLVKIARTEGVKTLFAGNATMVLRYGPSKGLNFATFHFFNSNLHAIVEKRREKRRTAEASSKSSSKNRRRTARKSVEVLEQPEKKKTRRFRLKCSPERCVE